MRILSLIAWVCLGGVLPLGAQTFNQYGNRTDSYDSSDPFNRDQVYPGGMDSLNIFGERILSPREPGPGRIPRLALPSDLPATARSIPTATRIPSRFTRSSTSTAILRW